MENYSMRLVFGGRTVTIKDAVKMGGGEDE